MATYFHGAPEIQSDGLQTLYLMNPSYAGYPDAAAPANMVYQNSTMNYLNPMPIPHNLQSMMAPPHDYNLWTPAASNNPTDLRSPSQLGHHHPLQGLSLSLSPGKAQYSPATMMPEMKTMGCLASGSGSNGNPGLHSGLMGSKYLKAAQMLLDEIVIVQGGLGKGAESKSPKKSSRVAEADSEVKGIADLTTVERQEIQMKKSKLVSMLDEVEQRYKQYRHQIQLLISSFEAVAGLRSARTYTALALQTISKQFRRLRHTISDQIRATGKILGEDCGLIGSGGSRLRFVDHQLSQQRALQQLGTMQHNAWRPQRGLPEHAVSVLRAWLFEHFLHPYPKDADKHMLAKQTGLTRSQVSNWFINARVRLWKPMVEEMYLQEFKEQEENNPHEKASQTDIAQEETESKSSAQQERSPSQTEQNETLMQPSLKKTRMEMKPETMSNHDLLMKFIDREGGWENGYHGGGFSSYSIGEIGKSNHEQFAPRISGNCVSLTLGLPHDENPIVQLGKREEMSTDVNEYYRLSSYRTL